MPTNQDQTLVEIKASIDHMEHYLSIIARYYELKRKAEFPDED